MRTEWKGHKRIFWGHRDVIHLHWEDGYIGYILLKLTELCTENLSILLYIKYISTIKSIEKKSQVSTRILYF